MTTAIDLRPEHDETDNQGPNPACGYYALANALNCIVQRAKAPITRISPSYLWWFGREAMGMAGQSVGATFDSLKAALEHGFVTAEQWPDAQTSTRPTVAPIGNGQLVRTRTPSIDGITRLLGLGVPLIALIDLYAPFFTLRGNWRTHQWTPTGQPHGMHYVVIVGIDHQAGMLLIENSWGNTWGDGGFGGIPFDVLPKINQGIQHINWINPALPFVPAVPQDPAAPFGPMSLEALEFVQGSKAYFRQQFANTLEEDGLEAVIKEAAAMGMTDKHLEWLFDLPRFAIRQHAVGNPSLAWGTLRWEQP